MRGFAFIAVGVLGMGLLHAQTPAPTANPATLGPPFRTACWYGDLAKVTDLLNQGAPIEGSDNLGRKPLLLAARGHPDVVKLLLDHGAKVDAPAFNGDTAIGHACETGDLASAQLLITAGANINQPNKFGHTPLMLAAENGHDDLISFLIAQKVDLNFESKYESALEMAVWKDHPTTMKLLLDAGEKLPQPPAPGPVPQYPTIMVLGAMTGDPAVMDLLLAHGANINEVGKNGFTPLLMVINLKKADTVTYLLEKGADPNIPDETGMTPLVNAILMKEPTMTQDLMSHHANLEAKDELGRTALIHAVMHDNNFAIQALVDLGADVNATDAKGETVLNYAANLGDDKAVQLLKDKGAHPQDPHIIVGQKPAEPLTPVQNWALAVSAIYDQTNGCSPYLLGSGNHPQTGVRLLRDQWNVTDKKTLLAELDDLRDKGHHTDYQTEGAKAAAMTEADFAHYISTMEPDAAHREMTTRVSYLKWKERSGLAWDIVRSANLVNFGVAANYLDEQEAWNHLFAIAELAQKSFSSWQEMNDNFLDGREIWANARDPQFEACSKLLLNPNDPNSPWNQNPWKTSLGPPAAGN